MIDMDVDMGSINKSAKSLAFDNVTCAIEHLENGRWLGFVETEIFETAMYYDRGIAVSETVAYLEGLKEKIEIELEKLKK